MVGGDFITVEGVVSRLISERLFRVRLENGHELNGFVSRPLAQNINKISLEEGSKVVLHLTPFDLSKGQIVEVKGQKQ
ncbi:MAG: translation initiation factor IF-1 [Verrucomicrobiae bacterium]|nr:translation initiation factor IF-1 [Verrucomicrobiae bacterium]